MATVMSDEVFHDVAYKAKKREHLLAGLDEFLDSVTVLPPGEWDPSIRIEPPQKVKFYAEIMRGYYSNFPATISRIKKTSK